jgi:hypothetical protein
MSTLDLIFDGKVHSVPKKCVLQLVAHRELFEAKTYAVESSVPVDVFEAFVASLRTETKISVTQGNAVSVRFLANEFFLAEVAAEAASVSVSVDQFLRLSDRVSALERQLSSFSNRPGEIEEQIESLEERLFVWPSIRCEPRSTDASIN